MELASCDPSGTYSFEMTPRSLEKPCTPELNCLIYTERHRYSSTKFDNHLRCENWHFHGLRCDAAQIQVTYQKAISPLGHLRTSVLYILPPPNGGDH